MVIFFVTIKSPTAHYAVFPAVKILKSPFQKKQACTLYSKPNFSRS